MTRPGARRGTDRERKLREQLEADGWVVARAAGSRGCADLMASKLDIDGTAAVRLIQVKSDAGNPYAHFGPAERRVLAELAEQAGASAWLVWWPPRRGPQWIPASAWPRARAAA